MIKIVEDTMLKDLQEIFNDFTVDSFPSKFEDYLYTSSKGCVLIRFEGAKFQNQNTIYAVNSNGTYSFTVFFSLRYAQKHNEAYDFLKLLKKALNGLEILNKRLVLKEINYETEINGDLWYSLSVEIELPSEDEHKSSSYSDEVIEILYPKEKNEGVA